jgi:hypothetical protein
MFQAYLPMAKLAVQAVSGFGVSKILGDVVKNNVTILTPAQAVSVKVGSFVLGSILWEQSSNHIERMTDDLVKLVQKRKEETEDTPETL